MKDWLGQEIEVGDLVLWPRQMGHMLEMAIGQVTEFLEVPHAYITGKVIQKVRIQPTGTSRYPNQHSSGRPILIEITKNLTKYRSPDEEI